MGINYDIEDLRAFCTLVRAGQYTAAASQLCITTSALSRRVAKLEDRIGGKLFERTTRRVVVTPIGRTLYERVLPAVSRLDACLLEASRAALGQGGNLAVGTVASVGYSVFPKVLPAFYAAHPHTYLSIRDANATVVAKLVEDGEVEFGVTTVVSFPQSLVIEKAAVYGYNLVYAKGSALRPRRRTLTWTQVSDLPVVGLHPLSSTRLQIDSVLHASGIALPWKIEVDQLATMVGLVQTGDFVAVMPGLFDAAGYGLQSVPVGAPDIVRDIYLVRRHDVSLSPAGQSLLGLIRERLGAG
ncbi:LysR family transcriptional regulator [Achromobacter deleyi]|uniref:LysR family transcriptional regulator n=1 Tax=Achromobacter deleyi TaxID=1353891 RepID=UPI001465B42D|nr:LysR family transcriptional regulator [Achromobacter deleyi]CAB3861138.1 HTH-type transcriptional regulator BenM [Achromobacter deleyi]